MLIHTNFSQFYWCNILQFPPISLPSSFSFPIRLNSNCACRVKRRQKQIKVMMDWWHGVGWQSWFDANENATINSKCRVVGSEWWACKVSIQLVGHWEYVLVGVEGRDLTHTRASCSWVLHGVLVIRVGEDLPFFMSLPLYCHEMPVIVHRLLNQKIDLLLPWL